MNEALNEQTNRQHTIAHTIAVAGIDTGVGKTCCAGLLARYLLERFGSCSTIKLVQTGCMGIAEDIATHRRLMGIPLTEEDSQHFSNPFVFEKPASPALAARLEGKAVTEAGLDEAVSVMQSRFRWLLAEGAGGLLVPINHELLMLDYFARHAWPLVLVTNPRLGSINHTRLSLEAIKNRNMRLLGLAYNLHGDFDSLMVRDTLQECRRALADYGFPETVVLVPDMKESAAIGWDPLIAPLLAEEH